MLKPKVKISEDSCFQLKKWQVFNFWYNLKFWCSPACRLWWTKPLLEYVYGLCYLCTRMYVTFFCDHQSPSGRDMLQLPFYSWEHDKIHDHILCFSPGHLFHTSYTGIWGKIPGDSSEGCLNLGYCAGKGVLVHKAMHLWHYCITSGTHTSSHWLDIFIRRYRENWKLTCFTWNYARILIKYFLFAVGETCFVTVVIMCKNNGCEALIKPCWRGWFWCVCVWGGFPWVQEALCPCLCHSVLFSVKEKYFCSR